VGLNLGDGCPRDGLLAAHRLHGQEDVREGVVPRGGRVRAVAHPVGMEEVRARSRPLQDQAAIVDRGVMGLAQDQQVLLVMVAAF
jgi:hypothetical protein